MADEELIGCELLREGLSSITGVLVVVKEYSSGVVEFKGVLITLER